MQGFPASLSKEVLATVNGYERRETEGDRVTYYIKADRAVSFADNHQELENVYLEVFNEDGSASDRMTAGKAVYVPAENKNFTVYFAGAVDIQTRDGLRVLTEQLSYEKATEIARAEELSEFERENVKGRSVGAVVYVQDKRLELLRNVELSADGDDGSTMRVSADSAAYDQVAERLDLTGSVNVAASSPGDGGRNGTLAADRATVYLTLSGKQRQLGKAEMFDSVRVTAQEGQQPQIRFESGYALYVKPDERFELQSAVHILSGEGAGGAEAWSESAVYEQPQGRATLSGGARLKQGAGQGQGNSIYAELDSNGKVRYAEVRGDAVVTQHLPERTTEVRGPQIRADLNGNDFVTKAAVTGAGTAMLVPSIPGEYTKVTMNAGQAMHVDFKDAGVLSRINTRGRTRILMEVPNTSAASTNKALSADTVAARFSPDGKDLTSATANGNGELVVTPLNAGPTAYATTIKAPGFECGFFAGTSDPEKCTAASKTRTVRVPTQPPPGRGDQILAADRLSATFDRNTRDLSVLEALGNARFDEMQRHAVSEKIVYTSSDGVVRLRGGEPVVWDDKARAKGPEIDWDTRNERSEVRGGASTTYYSASSSGGATPFGRSEKPVYVTANTAKFDHRAEVAVFTGNARGWQDKSYVRGERMVISENDGTFLAEENVQSLLYEAKRRENGVETNQPIFVASQRLSYARENRLMRYENNVDIRQGKDRITGSAANIFLTENNEPSRTEIEGNVVIVQPTRRASGDYASYNVSTEDILLRGDPATVEDTEQGRSRASEITMNLRENRFGAAGPSKQNSGGRTRSVYKIKDQ
jgi:lipopolysaccharide transport protein LptA/LPS export ABC transporter protein LptC